MRNQQFRCGLDIDGVLRDFLGAAIKSFLIAHPNFTHKDINPTAGRLEKIFPASRKEITKFIWHSRYTREIFEKARPLPGAQAGVVYLTGVLKSINGKLIFISDQQPTARAYTLRWLTNNFPSEILQEIHFLRHKASTNIDVLIDDHLRNLKEITEAGGRGLCIQQPWNTIKKHPYTTCSSITEAAEHIRRLYAASMSNV